MDKQGDIEALRALQRDQAAKTKMARLRDIFEEIEATQNAGVPNKKIIEALNARGYDLTPKTFESAIYRIRKERDQSGTPKSEVPNSPTNPVAPAVDQSEPSSVPPSGKGGATPSASRKITNPAELRRSRQRDLNLDEYINPDTEDG